jgi:hypothetical protein
MIRAIERFLLEVKTFEAAIGSYEKAGDKLHEGIWKWRHQHDRFCEPPLRLLPYLEKLRRTLESLVRFSLDPQLPEHMRGNLRRGLLSAVETTLADHDWTPDEIIAVIDDGRGGSARKRKDRLRHRLDDFRIRTAA